MLTGVRLRGEVADDAAALEVGYGSGRRRVGSTGEGALRIDERVGGRGESQLESAGSDLGEAKTDGVGGRG